MSIIYNKAKESFMKGLLDLTGGDIKANLVLSSYSENAADTHTTLLSVIVSPQVTVTSPTVSSTGVFDAADLTFPSVASGSNIGGILIYKETTTSLGAGSTLIAHITTGSTFNTNGANVVVTFDGNGIFKL